MSSQQVRTASSDETIWVLGGGQFGRRAVKLLYQETPTATIIMVDKQPLLDVPEDIEIVCADAIDWLVEQFTPDAVVTRIIPAIPLHMAVEWLKKMLLKKQATMRATEIPDELLHHCPHPFRISSSKVAVSHADFLCPPNCAEPDEFCTYTQQQRPLPLYQLLETEAWGVFTPLIIRSRQFARGVGGFYPDDLWNLLQRVLSLPETPLLIGTACKCHGIIDGLTIQYSSKLAPSCSY